MSSRKNHVFPLNKLKQGIETFELLSFDLFKLSLEILTLIKYGVIMTKNLYFHVFIHEGTLQLQKKSFSFASSSLILRHEQRNHLEQRQHCTHAISVFSSASRHI